MLIPKCHSSIWLNVHKRRDEVASVDKELRKATNYDENLCVHIHVLLLIFIGTFATLLSHYSKVYRGTLAVGSLGAVSTTCNNVSVYPFFRLYIVCHMTNSYTWDCMFNVGIVGKEMMWPFYVTAGTWLVACISIVLWCSPFDFYRHFCHST